HEEPGSWPGNEVCREYEFAEVIGQQQHNAPYAAAHHLAYADFLRMTLRIEGRQAEQAEAGNHDGKGGKPGKQLLLSCFVFVHREEVLLQVIAAVDAIRVK